MLSSVRRCHASLLCIVPICIDHPRIEASRSCAARALQGGRKRTRTTEKEREREREREKNKKKREREREKAREKKNNNKPTNQQPTEPPPFNKKTQRATVAQKHTALRRKIAHPVPLWHCWTTKPNIVLVMLAVSKRPRATAPPGLTLPGPGATTRGCAHHRDGHSLLAC